MTEPVAETPRCPHCGAELTDIELTLTDCTITRHYRGNEKYGYEEENDSFDQGTEGKALWFCYKCESQILDPDLIEWMDRKVYGE